jgi:hypothetical protein
VLILGSRTQARGRYQPPAGRLEIRWDHPITRNLVCALIAGVGEVRDVYLPRSLSIKPTYRVGKPGRMVRDLLFTAGNNDALVNLTAPPHSFGAFFNLPQLPGTGEDLRVFQRALYTNESTNNGWAISVTASNDPNPNQYRTLIFNSNGTPNYNVLLGAATVGDHFVVGTQSTGGAGFRLGYLDGAFANNDASGGSRNVTCTTCATGLQAGVTAGASAVGLYVGYVWRRIVSADEVAQLWADPWACVTAVPRRSYALVHATPLVPGTARQRRTLLTLGSRVGTRQARE